MIFSLNWPEDHIHNLLCPGVHYGEGFLGIAEVDICKSIVKLGSINLFICRYGLRVPFLGIKYDTKVL